MRNARLMAGPSIAIIALSLGGCVTTMGTAINPTHTRAPVPVATVLIYETADKTPGKYEEIALLDTRSDSVLRSQAATLESIREAAEVLGANGVILAATIEPGAGAKVASFLFLGSDAAGRRNKSVAIFVSPLANPPGT